MQPDERQQRLRNLSPAKRQRLLALLRQDAGVQRASSHIPRLPGEGPFTLSYAQQRLWFVDRLLGATSAYNIAFGVRLDGPLVPRALRDALREVERRHAVLRSRYRLVAGQPRMEIRPEAKAVLPVCDLALDTAGAEALAHELSSAEARRPVDLAGGPMLRGRLLRLAPRRHVLLVTVHHIASDGWSSANLVRELTQLYRAFAAGEPSPLPELAIQYADYAAWQRAALDGEGMAEHLAFWRRELAGAPTLLDLPSVRPRPPVPSFRGAVEPLLLPAGLLVSLRARARERGATLFMTLVAAFQGFLARLSGRPDLLVGTPVANRNHPDLEPLIGFFVNTLVLRGDVRGNPSFNALLERTRTKVLAAFEHGEIAFEKLVDEMGLERDMSYAPLIQVLFAFQNTPREEASWLSDELVSTPFRGESSSSKFDLTLTMAEVGDRLEGGLEYSLDLFDRTTARRWVGHFAHFLQALVAAPDRPLAELPWLAPADLHQLLSEWNDSRAAELLADGSLGVCVAEAAAGRPAAVAVSFEGDVLTSAELMRRVGVLAGRLRALGVGPDVPVGVYAERSLEMVGGLLAVLRAGGAYVPLSPRDPAERLASALEDLADLAPRPVVLVGEGLTLPLSDAEPVVRAPLCLPPVAERASGGSPPVGEAGVRPDNLAYVIFTSGSTGKPKGVMNTHRAILNRLRWMQAAYGLGPADRVLQKTPFTFDVSVWEFFWPLLTGAQLVVARPEGHRDNAYLARLIAERRISTLHFVPSMLRAFLETPDLSGDDSLSRVISSGEALPGPLVRRLVERLPGARLHNLYGPTEAAVDVTFQPCEGLPDGPTVPIGRPISNLQIVLLDRQLQPVPLGVAGELCIAGIGLARGYVSSPRQTAERFVPDPRGSEVAGRLYRTGDLARTLPDGGIEYVGRTDHQVKIRGFRIELGEVEAVLGNHPGVREAAVVARPVGGEAPRLVAYVVSSEGDSAAVESYREHLAARLPDYMVPAFFVPLKALPLTPSGKLDRRALPDPGGTRPELAADYVPPQSSEEEVLAAIWGEVLGIDRVGVHDNFFSLGGDSLLSLRVMALAEERGLGFSLQELFRHQTVASLAGVVSPRRRGRTGEASGPLTERFSLLSAAERETLPEDVEDAYPLSSLQAGMLYHMAMTPEEPLYHNVDSWHLRACIEIEPFHEAVRRVVARHPILRTSFDLEAGGRPLQRVHRSAELPVEFEDIGHLDAGEQERWIDRRIAAEKRRLFDLSRPPQLRIHVARRSADTLQLTVTENHAALDGWSLHATLAEIFELYFALAAGEEPAPSPSLRSTYRDFIYLEQQTVADPEAEAFWTRMVADMPALELPRWVRGGHIQEEPSPRRSNAQGERRVRSWPLHLSPEVLTGLEALARRAAVPLKSVLLAVHMEVLGLLSGQPEVTTGLVANGRPETADGDQVRGLFLNTLPLRLRRAAGSWRELAQRAFFAEDEILAWRRYPYAAIQRQWGPDALLEVAFNYIHFHVVRSVLDSGQLEVLGGRGAEGANFKLFAHFVRSPDASRLDLHLEHDSHLLSRAQVQAIAGFYLRVLEAAAREEGMPGRGGFAVHSAAQEQLLVREWNDLPAAPSPDRPLHSRFVARAELAPDAVAIVAPGERLSYGELQRRSRGLAAHLVAQGVGPEVRVGLCAERTPALIVGLLGVLRAGGAYVPLDPAYPEQRLAYMLGDAGVTRLLTERRWSDLLAASGLQLLWLDEVVGGDGPGTGSAPVPALPSVAGENLAYLIYTSGSTGQPKGVAIEHRSAAAFVEWVCRSFSHAALAGTLAATSVCFDLSIFEIFAPLSCGGKVLLATNALDLPDLPDRREVSLVNTVPSAIGEILREGGLPPTVATVNLAGEPLTGDLVRQLYAVPTVGAVLNLYGPSEDTTYSTGLHLSPSPRAGEPSIGRPLPGKRLYLVDRALRPVLLGAAGEICLGGHGLARGYLGRPALSAERFLPDPWSDRPGQRLYRTGDLGRYRLDGEVDFLGRIDHQIKIRGYRVELGEIEVFLRRHPSVDQALVMVWSEPALPPRLAAYVVGRDGECDPQELREHLRQQLPEYMVPAAFVPLAAFPLLPNGKIDRRALPRPQALARPGYVAPRDELERSLAGIWSALLQVERVGADDNFFDLGGHSLLMIQLRRRIREQFRQELSMVEMFRFSTVGLLAQRLRQAEPGAASIAKTEVRSRQREEGKQRLKQRLRDRERQRWS